MGNRSGLGRAQTRRRVWRMRSRIPRGVGGRVARSDPNGGLKQSASGGPNANLYIHNRPFAGSGHMVRNKSHWDANDAAGLPKQRKVGLEWYEFLCFGNPTALFASQCNLFRTM